VFSIECGAIMSSLNCVINVICARIESTRSAPTGADPGRLPNRSPYAVAAHQVARLQLILTTRGGHAHLNRVGMPHQSPERVSAPDVDAGFGMPRDAHSSSVRG
jgi:hypothetical protein